MCDLTDPYQVVKVVLDLNNKSSAGIDDIPTTVMSLFFYIAVVLSELIYCSFRTQLFPDQLKIAKLCPIFKGGSDNIFLNYKLISILLSFSNFFKKIAYLRIEKYIICNNIITNNQYDF